MPPRSLRSRQPSRQPPKRPEPSAPNQEMLALTKAICPLLVSHPEDWPCHVLATVGFVADEMYGEPERHEARERAIFEAIGNLAIADPRWVELVIRGVLAVDLRLKRGRMSDL